MKTLNCKLQEHNSRVEKGVPKVEEDTIGNKKSYELNLGKISKEIELILLGKSPTSDQGHPNSPHFLESKETSIRQHSTLHPLSDQWAPTRLPRKGLVQQSSTRGNFAPKQAAGFFSNYVTLMQRHQRHKRCSCSLCNTSIYRIGPYCIQ